MAEFPHIKLMKESEVDLKSLPDALKTKIKVFNLHKDRKSDAENSIASLSIAQEIYNYLESQDSGSDDTEVVKDNSEEVTVEVVAPVVPVAPVEPVIVAPVAPVEPPVEVAIVTPPSEAPQAPVEQSPAAPVAKEKKGRWVPMLGWVDFK